MRLSSVALGENQPFDIEGTRTEVRWPLAEPSMEPSVILVPTDSVNVLVWKGKEPEAGIRDVMIVDMVYEHVELGGIWV